MTNLIVVKPAPGASIRESVPEGWYLVSDAAEMVGRSADTLRKYRRDEVFTPSGFMMAGELKVYLYSEDDIEELGRLIPTIRPGRKI